MTLDPHISLTAGRLVWSYIRDYVVLRNAQGFHLRLSESSGFLEKIFVITGPDDELLQAQTDMERLIAELEKSA